MGTIQNVNQGENHSREKQYSSPVSVLVFEGTKIGVKERL